MRSNSVALNGSLCMSVFLSICLLSYLAICLSSCLSTCLASSPSTYRSVYSYISFIVIIYIHPFVQHRFFLLSFFPLVPFIRPFYTNLPFHTFSLFSHCAFLPSYLSSFPHSSLYIYLTFFLPAFLPSFLTFYLPSFLPTFVQSDVTRK